MMKERKGRQVFRNATAVRSFANFDEPNFPRRHTMEDESFFIDCYLDNTPKSALFGVFDGHGGSEVSQYLVKCLPQIIKQTYAKGKKRGRALFEESFDIADKRLNDMDMEAGSTATVCLLTLEQAKRVLYVAHVGDSTAYLFDDSSCEKLTPEHRCDNPEEIKRVKQAGGKILMGRLSGQLAVTRAFGDFGLKKGMGLTAKPEVRKVQVRLSHKYIVIASDGLWDFVPVKKVQQIMRQMIEPDDIARTLLKLAFANESGDNISVIVARL